MSTKFTNNVYLDTQEGNKTPIKKGQGFSESIGKSKKKIEENIKSKV